MQSKQTKCMFNELVSLMQSTPKPIKLFWYSLKKKYFTESCLRYIRHNIYTFTWKTSIKSSLITPLTLVNSMQIYVRFCRTAQSQEHGFCKSVKTHRKNVNVQIEKPGKYT